MGIIQSKVFWLSMASMLNDYMEHKWLINKAITLLRQHTSESVRGETEKLISYLNNPESPYICCFSSEPDTLSQWRAYCDDGTGFAIGFSGQALHDICSQYHTDNNVFSSLLQVVYEDEAQIEILSSYLNKTVMEHSILVAFVGIAIHANAICCKNHAFQEEHEWRIVQTPMMLHHYYNNMLSLRKDLISKLSFRKTGNRIVPYFTLHFPIDAIKEIRLGPKNVARDNRDSIHLLLTANGYDVSKIKIINSEATYR